MGCPSSSSTRALTARTCASLISPRAIPLWLETTPAGTPAARSRASASRAPSTSSTRSGSPLYGTSFTRVPSRSNSTAEGGFDGEGAVPSASP